jgi:hypothetical protein
LELSEKPIANPWVVFKDEFDDWVLLFHPLTAEAVGLDPVGAAIWKTIDGHCTVAEIASAIAAQYEEAPPAATILEDTLDFVQDLERRFFLRVRPEG